MINLATAKLIGIGIGALAVLALLAIVNGWRVERNHLRDQVAAACDATREASANPKLNCKAMPQQIRLLGKAVLDLKLAIIDQNDAVRRMADASAKAQQDAVKAVSAAARRAKAAQSVSDRLSASANDPARKKEPCRPSEELVSVWR